MTWDQAPQAEPSSPHPGSYGPTEVDKRAVAGCQGGEANKYQQNQVVLQGEWVTIAGLMGVLEDSPAYLNK